jgi:predicted DNA-binding transcriptional regulator AlpA
MLYFTTQQAAKKLGIGLSTLIRYIVEKKVPAPEATKIGKREVRAWTEDNIRRVQETLPKIANGRKTRYQKQKPGVRSQQRQKLEQNLRPRRKTRNRNGSANPCEANLVD